MFTPILVKLDKYEIEALEAIECLLSQAGLTVVAWREFRALHVTPNTKAQLSFLHSLVNFSTAGDDIKAARLAYCLHINKLIGVRSTNNNLTRSINHV